MTRLLELLYRYRKLLVFLFLEIVAFVLVVQYNNPQRGAFRSFMLSVGGGLNQANANVVEYLHLRGQNRQLMETIIKIRKENQRLQEQLAHYRSPGIDSTRFKAYPDSVQPAFNLLNYLPCRVIENNTRGNFNYMVLNIGANEGVEPGMGILSVNGVAGLVTHTSPDYALGMSVLNANFRLSAMIKSKGIVGTFMWDGQSSRYANLRYVPLHYQPNIGDTIITSNYSTVFPEGIVLGRISSIREGEDSGFYDIEVQLATDFHRLNHVFVTFSPDQAEIDTLKAQTAQ